MWSLSVLHHLAPSNAPQARPVPRLAAHQMGLGWARMYTILRAALVK